MAVIQSMIHISLSVYLFVVAFSELAQGCGRKIPKGHGCKREHGQREKCLDIPRGVAQRSVGRVRETVVFLFYNQNRLFLALFQLILEQLHLVSQGTCFSRCPCSH